MSYTYAQRRQASSKLCRKAVPNSIHTQPEASSECFGLQLPLRRSHNCVLSLSEHLAAIENVCRLPRRFLGHGGLGYILRRAVLLLSVPCECVSHQTAQTTYACSNFPFLRQATYLNVGSTNGHQAPGAQTTVPQTVHPKPSDRNAPSIILVHTWSRKLGCGNPLLCSCFLDPKSTQTNGPKNSTRARKPIFSQLSSPGWAFRQVIPKALRVQVPIY